MRENEWTNTIKEFLQDANLGRDIYFDTLRYYRKLWTNPEKKVYPSGIFEIQNRLGMRQTKGYTYETGYQKSERRANCC